MPSDDIGRTRRTRNSLTLEEILEAAEKLALDGFESVTIRAVAAELRSSPMALYRYVPTKEAMVAALLDRVLGRFTPGPETADWSRDLRDFAQRHRQLLLTHPWAVAPLIANPYPGANAVPIGEEALRILSRGGITGEPAVATFSGIIALNYGWCSFAIARRTDVDALDSPDWPEPPAEYPLTTAVSEPMSRYGSDLQYEIVLEQLARGIEAHASPGGLHN
jgi:AcrR family transcriptional regulator